MFWSSPAIESEEAGQRGAPRTTKSTRSTTRANPASRRRSNWGLRPHDIEDVLKEAGINLLPIRKKKSKRKPLPWLAYLQGR